ncbi:common pilus major fimbrillin subunit EcpA [Acinetobacter baumannii]|uniref:common pilus major fimbrillin subunit EcpA n=1 Tax=Acinetobacter baumannii TaxID=470 RepID=UPI0008198993|nr:common pilus major fimbrillin subunit EcpA [Acinetobacter baumannii]EIB7122007.1 fimbrial protein [Acinetobacter baumannii]MDC4419483.1 common pilus major fimbrillin subunit EcpA [Acinetobacter baumannii]MDC5317201.1 common pilus major fimbrillin subunit EcpA [Acinetobacter baumannii]MDV7501845.1 common pilus major fimbrillin subunit EcpA [Acinetobacter baumannii]MDV7527670.1 common pilus major fimbrillin subunit EcpA [Acinetobacter baumannii]
MKKLVSAFAILSASSLFATPVFADVAASSTAKWDATATKDTTSMLVVTPLKSLNFQYAEGLKQFNTQTGAFDVTIQGQSGATDFQLSSKLISNTLTRGDNASTLDVGVMWNGTALSKTTETTLVDTANGISAGLDALADAAIYAGSGRNSAQGDFTFKIESATSDGLTTAQYEDLADGVWDGEVAVQFNANWTTP